MTAGVPDPAPTSEPIAPQQVDWSAAEPVAAATIMSTAEAAAVDATTAATAVLKRRGFLKTEYWTSVVAVLISVVLAAAHVGAGSAQQIAAATAPVVVAIAFQWLRVMEKRALAQMAERLHFGSLQ